MRLHDAILVIARTEMLDRSPERVAAVQRLIDHGVVWQLRPYIGMVAEWMIDQGLCKPRKGCGRVSRCGRKLALDTSDK